MRQNTSIFLTLITSFLFVQSCTNKKNTVVTRTYHNITSRYNVYFNANEALKEGVTKLEISAKEDYSQTLPVFLYGTKEDAKTILPEMEKCYKKASMTIERHSIHIKGKEYCKWIDDAYLLIGKSHLYKHDYFPALEAFEYVANEFKKDPNRYQAKLWMARAYNELGNVTASEELLDELKADRKFPKKELAGQMAAIEADLYLRRKDNGPAASWLKKAVKLSKNKKEKIRYNFILAQLLQEQGDNKKAQNYYNTVLKMHPTYEMAFYARLNSARCLEANSKNSKTVKKQLVKMSKDGKNEEYRDQIFYTLAQMEQKEGNTKQAIDYLEKSIHASKTNQKQKGVSCLNLADLYFERPDYVLAQAFYDSAVAFLPKSYPYYSEIENKRNSLGKLVAYIDTVKSNDSLVKLSRLSDKEKQAIVDKEIKKRIDDYYKQKELYREQEQKAANGSPAISTNAAGIQSGAWYFYNPTTLAFGINDFTKKWGNRKLEDNWRRKDKQSSSGSEEATPALSEEDIDRAAIEQIKEPKQYLSKIPTGDSALTKSNRSIENSLFNLGIIYEQQLNNHEKAAEAFDDLLERYPNTTYKLTVYYQLYRIYMAMEEKTKADKYKNLLLQDDPNSEFSQLITNPEFVTAEGSKAKASKLYEDTYQSYKNNDFATVVDQCNTASKLYSKSELIPKFDYLKALAIGKTKGLDNMEKSLKEVILKHPLDPVKDEAQNLLNLISKQKPAIAAKDTTKTAALTDSLKNQVETSLYNLNKDTSHVYIILYNPKEIQGSTLESNVSNFNQLNFSTSGLSYSNILFNENKFALIVKSFVNKEKAMLYFDAISNNADVFKNLDKQKTEQFVVSENNLSTLLKQRKTEDYNQFFSEKYLVMNK